MALELPSLLIKSGFSSLYHSIAMAITHICRLLHVVELPSSLRLSLKGSIDWRHSFYRYCAHSKILQNLSKYRSIQFLAYYRQ